MAIYRHNLLFLIPFACTITFAVSVQGPKQFIYNGFTNSHLNLVGTAKIHTNGLLQLTNSSQQQKGISLFQEPIKLSESPLLSTTFAFAIYPEMTNDGGHGISFVLSPSVEYFNHTLADEYLGLFNYSTNGKPSNHLFAVELDTVKTPSFEDIDGNHVGVDVNNLTSIGSAPVGYYSDKEKKNISLSLLSGKPMQVWIDYDANKTLVNVAIAPLGELKPKKFLLSTRINLSKVLHDNMYVGLCSTTGTLFSSHYILGWSFNQSGEAEKLDLSKLPSLPKVEKPKKKVSPPLISLITIVLIFFIICGAAFYAIRRKKYEEVLEDWEKEYVLHRFSYKELYQATNGFKEKGLLGCGGFGKVYKGVIPSTKAQVAIKKVSHDSRQGMKEFVAEVSSMRRLRHRNLLPLLGYCRRKCELILASTSSDVFSFGVFLLEVACGRKPIDTHVVLVDLVLECWNRGAILEASDPRLEEDYNPAEMELVLSLGLLCSQTMQELRPSMRHVVQFLNRDAQITQLPRTLPEIGLFPRRSASFPLLSVEKASTDYSYSRTDSFVTYGISSSQDPINFIYNGFQGSNLHLNGIANIHPNGLLQLTNNSQQQKGYVFYPFPIKIGTSPKFSTTFVFAMYPHLPNGGHGIAFILSPSMDFSSALASEFFGLFNNSSNGHSSNHVFAVELDTIYSPLFGDIDNNHIGVDMNSLNSVEAETVKYYSNQEKKNVSLRLLSTKPMQVWIDYDSKKLAVEVSIAPLGKPKPNQLLLSTPVNLSEILLHTAYVGFSASTGVLTSDQYLIGWSFSTNGKAGMLDVSKLPSLPIVKAPKRKINGPLIGLIAVVSIFLVVLVCAGFIIRRRKYEEVMEDWEEEYAVQRYSYRYLYEATKGFKDSELLGKGVFGKRGLLSSTNSQIAVKRVSHDSRQGMKEFVAEIASMRRLRHRNLVPLLGYCRRKGELLLVYEYMPNGSLDKLLFNKENPPLSWLQRLKIIKGVASALLYLHEEWEQVVLHRDIKASNVLLDANMEAKLGDFGLARLYDHGTSTQTTHVVGTIGYLAPEIPRTGKATTSTDVYAFGIFILEVVSGKRPLEIDCSSEDHDTLLEWVFHCWKNGVLRDAVDPRLEDKYVVKEMDLVLKLGLLCSQTRHEERPSMRRVMQFLNGDDLLPHFPLDCIEMESFIHSRGLTSSSFPLLSSGEMSTFIRSNGLLQLTSSSDQKGISLYQEPIRLSESPNFSTTFAFAIYPDLETMGGHGITFFLSPSVEYFNYTSGDQYLGIFNDSSNGKSYNHLFAVELDTVYTPRFGDIDSNHVGVDVNGLRSVNASSAMYYSEKEQKYINFSLISSKPMQVWIDYDSKKTLVKVAIAPLGQKKPSKVLLSTQTNLSKVLFDEVYVGLSASTSSIFSAHYIMGWSFNQSGEAEEFDLSKLPKLPKKPKKKLSALLVALFSIVSFFVLIFVGAVYAIRRRRFQEVLEDWEKDYALQRFSYKELHQATKGFTEKELLGSGGFGKVYKGVIPSTNAQVAVKRVSHDSRQGMKEFVAEVVSMRRLRHRNLVPLLGYCRRKRELILVYEYMSNGSLDSVLYSKDKPTLPWSQRFKIVKGVASALLYLHEEWEQVVLHRDVKASNVLLDSNMDARLGDFGLARLYDHGTDPQTTHLVGTVGYLAPELSTKGKASTSTDVFAFGIFLLEVACGKRPIDTEISPQHLVDWVMECSNRGAILVTSDPRLEGEYKTDEMELVLRLGLVCSQPRDEARPSMRQVVQFLNRDSQSSSVLSSQCTGKSASFPPQSSKKALMNNLYDRTYSLVETYGLLLGSAQAATNLIYNGFNESNLHLDGLAYIHPNGLLQLTNSSILQTGHAFYPFPLNLSSSPQISTTFVFAIRPHPSHGGHGMAFVIASSMDLSQGGNSEFLGLVNESTNSNSANHLFAVEIDTVYSPQVADLDGNHLGIDVNSLTSIEAAQAGYYSDKKGKNVSLNLLSGKPMQVWMDYDAKKSLVEVAIAPLGVSKPSKLLLSKSLNLSNTLLETIYIGFSASTGLLNSDHYVLGWSFSSNGTAGNLDLSKLPSLPKVKKKLNRPLVALVTVLSALVVILVGVAYEIRRRKYEEVIEDWEEEYAVQRISYKDLYDATKGFDDEELLGKGGFGKVFRGLLSSTNSVVAIKRVSHDSKQGMKEFVAEIASMRRLRHKNLVPLLGYCRRKSELLLVYEYMPNGSLDTLLFKKETPTLPWTQRLIIIKGVASALRYLHEEWEQVVLHRDIKASNVLLDKEMNARLGDFGLARLYDHGAIARTTHVVGTLGFLAPELPRTGKATTNTDVYAFGVFILEVACGKRPLLLERLCEEDTLIELVFCCWNRGVILEAADDRLEGHFVVHEMELVLKLGLICAQARSETRPKMSQVMRFLDGEEELPKVPIDCLEPHDSYLGSPGSSYEFPLLSSNDDSDAYLCIFPNDSTQFVYNGFKDTNLLFKGISSLHSNGLIQLTNTTQHKAGYAFYPNPVNFTKSRSFSSYFVFAIHPNIPDHGAQGMAFFISPSMDFSQALPDEFLGLVNSTTNGLASNHIFAIELDTVQNAHFADIDSNHVGIDVNSLRSNSSSSASYFSSKEGKNLNLTLTDSKPFQLWLDYDESTTVVRVTIAPFKVSKPSKSLLSTKVNLSEVLLDTMYIGFSGSTGLTSNDHFVLGWSWNQTGQAQGLDLSKLPSLPNFDTSNRRPGKIFIALLVSVLFLLAVISASAYAIRRKKYEELKEAWEKEYATHRYSYKELYKATKGFKSTEFLGSGGHGEVYKGVLRRHKSLEVAIKRIKHESGQGMKEFVAEIVSMRRLRHRNLVQLLGYCRRKGELYLVYDYMPNGSLDKYLYGDEKPTLGWQQRLKIIRDVAAALLYLHEEWEQVVLHRDVKASNVMLDSQMNARLGDFGLARLYDHGANPRTTHVVGTVGYLAPEFVRTGKATTHCDVFSYGAFVLEVACGRSPIETENSVREDEEELVSWVFGLLRKGLILNASDPKLQGRYDSEEMDMALKIGLLCSQIKAESRPSMRQVVQLLDGAAILPDVPLEFDEDGYGGIGAI
ncbi:LOW QUALITY PROTEIN: hypothetical protein V2J09_007048 [Rumex salicifolius]